MVLKNIIVTGGCGFIGSNFIRKALSEQKDWKIINIDSLTYAGNPENLSGLCEENQRRYAFEKGDITDPLFLESLFIKHAPISGVFHFAAESHVDRSIHGPFDFLKTNVEGTFRLLEASEKHLRALDEETDFRFIHVSTDEVYGSLGDEGRFTETTPYDPSSPYSASKASSDHFVAAWNRTYGFPAIITNCSNNYGPYQFPEKLIPLMIMNIIEEKPLPVYGTGANVRDWLYVEDHCDALITAFEKGRPGETYNIGGGAEKKNIEIVTLLCDMLDSVLGRPEGTNRKLITFVKDRLGHDFRYAIDSSKIRNELGWTPANSFEEAIKKTVDWYIKNQKWVERVRSGEYRKWLETNYGDLMI